MSQAHVVRRIAADPTSVALLLAAPGVTDGFPGLRVAPPRRTPTNFVADLELTADPLPADTRVVVGGVLTLGYVTAPAHPGVETCAELRFDDVPGAQSVPKVDGRRTDRTVEQLAEGFLASLATVAEFRSHAA